MNSQSMASPTQETNVIKFQRSIEVKYGLRFENYWDFHKWSVEHYEETWAEAFDFFEIIYSKPYTKIVEPHKGPEDLPKWFVGAKLNFAENLLRQDDGVALLLLGEERQTAEKVTFRQLRQEVAVLSSALRAVGVKSGDVIACYMSTRKEAAVAMLAAAAIGAMFTTVNPLMGVKAVTSRFEQVRPKILFTIDRHFYGGEEKDVFKNLPEIVKCLPDLELVVIVPSSEASLAKNISSVPKSCFYPHLLSTGLKEKGELPEPHYEQLFFSHPFIISFTSGTTGPPKGMIHSLGAALIGPLKEMSFAFNVQPTDVMFTIHLLGWVSFSIFLAPLALGACIVLYEGLPYFKRDPSYWDLIDCYGVTSVFLTPTVLEEMKNKNLVPGPHNTLKTLRILSSGASPVKSYVYDFVWNNIKKDLFFCPLYGCTEFFTMTAGPNYSLPVHKEEIQVPVLGLDLRCYNESGESIFDELGELVIANPSPTLPLYMWKDKNYEKYQSESFKKFPGVYWVGDLCIRNSKTGGFLVPGRCDDTVKNRGARFGCSEIYGVVNLMEEVDDSICVSRVDKDGHEVAVLFIKMKNGKEFGSEFVEKVKKQVKEELSFRHVPEDILPVKDIPCNVNGKKMEILVKKILAGAHNLPAQTIVNPQSLDEYFEYAKALRL